MMATLRRFSFTLSPSPPPFQPFDPSVDVLKFDSLHLESELRSSPLARTNQNAIQTSAYIQVQTSSNPPSESTNAVKWSDSSTVKENSNETANITHDDSRMQQHNDNFINSLHKGDKVKVVPPDASVGKNDASLKATSQKKKASELSNFQINQSEKKQEASKKRKIVASGVAEGQKSPKRVKIQNADAQKDMQKILLSSKQKEAQILKQDDGDRGSTASTKGQDEMHRPDNGMHPSLNSQKPVQSPRLKIASQSFTQAAMNGKVNQPMSTQMKKNNKTSATQGNPQTLTGKADDKVLPKDIQNESSTAMQDSAYQDTTMQDTMDDYELEYVDDPPVNLSTPKALASSNLSNKQERTKPITAKSRSQEGDTHKKAPQIQESTNGLKQYTKSAKNTKTNTMQDPVNDDRLEYSENPPITSSPSKAFADLDLSNTQEIVKPNVEPSHGQKSDTIGTSTNQTKQPKQLEKGPKATKPNKSKPSVDSKTAAKLSEEERQKRLEDRRFGVFHSDHESDEEEIEIVSMSMVSKAASANIQKRPSLAIKEGNARPRPKPRKPSNTQDSEVILDTFVPTSKTSVQPPAATSSPPTTKRKEAPVELEKHGAKRSRDRARHSVLDSIQTPDLHENKSLAEGAMEAYGFSNSTQKLSKGISSKSQAVPAQKSSKHAEPNIHSSAPKNNFDRSKADSIEPNNDSIDDFDINDILKSPSPKPVLNSTSSLTPLEKVAGEDGEISSANNSDPDDSEDILEGRAKLKMSKGRPLPKPKAPLKKPLKTDDALKLLPGKKSKSKTGKFTDPTLGAKRILEMDYSQEQSQEASKKSEKELGKGAVATTLFEMENEKGGGGSSINPITGDIDKPPPTAGVQSQATRKGTLGTTVYGRNGQNNMKLTPSTLEPVLPPKPVKSATKPAQSPRKISSKANKPTTKGDATTQKKRGRPPKQIVPDGDDEDLYLLPPGKPAKKTTKKTLRGKKTQENRAMSPAVLHENNELKELFSEVDAFNIPEEEV